MRKAAIVAVSVVMLLICSLIFERAGYPADINEDGTFIRKYKSADNYFKKCKKYLGKGNLKKAEKGLRKCLEIMPQHVNSRFQLSRVLYRKGDLLNALVHIKEAKANYPTVARTILTIRKLNSHKIREKQKVLRETIDSYQGYEAIDGACAITPLLSEMRSEASAIDGKGTASATLPLQLPAEYFYHHGNILFKMKQYPEAFEQYHQTIRHDPRHKNAYNNLANLYFMSKKYQRALYYLENAEANGAGVNREFKQALLQRSVRSRGTTLVKPFIVCVGEKPRLSYENTYVVYDKAARDAFIVDPGVRDPRIDQFIASNRLTVKKILNTHGHSDHTGGNRYYAELYGVNIAIPGADNAYYKKENPGKEPYEFLSAGETGGTINCGSLKVTILHTPGHSPGSTCFLVNGLLLSGDTLFRHSVGRTWGRTKEEEQEKMAFQITNIKSKLLSLPGNTPVFPGHGPATTIGEEKSSNPYLK
ncbi:MAG: MBL fold metallo-hydrolase [bacterium]|nr:MBL fold metallo-hydrolase [bacterium]